MESIIGISHYLRWGMIGIRPDFSQNHILRLFFLISHLELGEINGKWNLNASFLLFVSKISFSAIINLSSYH